MKPNGVLYFWHNDMQQIAQLLEAIRMQTALAFISFCIWDKGEAYRAQSWLNRDPDGSASLRSWFNICEYCLHFFNAPKDADSSWKHTGLDRIKSNPECYKPIKEWYRAELRRLGLTHEYVREEYREKTGKSGAMFRHYFQDSQFELPTQEVYDLVFRPLGFNKEYEALRKEYEALRKEYEALRNTHHCDPMHCNIWHVPPVPSNNRLHTCQKPISILRRLIRVSSNPGDTVLDCFMGSGSTGIAAYQEGREFIGIEKEPTYFRRAQEWNEKEREQIRLAL